MAKIVTAEVEMDDHGKYTVTVVDYLADTTHIAELPDQYVGMLPLIMQQLASME
jgi:hypothetical protein